MWFFAGGKGRQALMNAALRKAAGGCEAKLDTAARLGTESTMNYSNELMKLADEELTESLSKPKEDSSKYEQIKFQMQRRSIVAQNKSALATERAAVATERYTCATWLLIAVTVVGLLIGAFYK
jgi:hypothetical protein